MSGAHGGDAESRGHDPRARSTMRSAYLIGGAVLAIVATAVLILTDNPRLLKVAVIVAVWACVLALLARDRPRQDGDLPSAREEELRRTYELEIDREVAARREYELRLEVAMRRELEKGHQKDLVELRSQIGSLRKEIAEMWNGELRLEHVAVQSTRLSGGDRHEGGRFGLDRTVIEQGTASFPGLLAAAAQLPAPQLPGPQLPGPQLPGPRPVGQAPAIQAPAAQPPVKPSPVPRTPAAPSPAAQSPAPAAQAGSDHEVAAQSGPDRKARDPLFDSLPNVPAPSYAFGSDFSGGIPQLNGGSNGRISDADDPFAAALEQPGPLNGTPLPTNGAIRVSNGFSRTSDHPGAPNDALSVNDYLRPNDGLPNGYAANGSLPMNGHGANGYSPANQYELLAANGAAGSTDGASNGSDRPAAPSGRRRRRAAEDGTHDRLASSGPESGRRSGRDRGEGQPPAGIAAPGDSPAAIDPELGSRFTGPRFAEPNHADSNFPDVNFPGYTFAGPDAAELSYTDPSFSGPSFAGPSFEGPSPETGRADPGYPDSGFGAPSPLDAWTPGGVRADDGGREPGRDQGRDPGDNDSSGPRRRRRYREDDEENDVLSRMRQRG